MNRSRNERTENRPNGFPQLQCSSGGKTRRQNCIPLQRLLRFRYSPRPGGNKSETITLPKCVITALLKYRRALRRPMVLWENEWKETRHENIPSLEPDRNALLRLKERRRTLIVSVLLKYCIE